MFVPVTDDEIPAVVALMNRAYRPSADATAWSNEVAYASGDRTTVALLRAELADRPAATLLRWADGTADHIVGIVWLEPLAGTTWYLGTLAIEPSRQSAGLGRAMLAAAEALIVEHGGRRVRLTVVNLRDALIAWYLRRGYHLTGETEPFPYEHNPFGTPLRDDLAFVVLEKALPAPS